MAISATSTRSLQRPKILLLLAIGAILLPDAFAHFLRGRIPSLDQGLRSEQSTFFSPGPADYIFIGNSMLWTRIDPKRFDELTGQRSRLLPAGHSAIWYYLLKNIALEMPHKPKAVFVFFRGEELTQPRLYVDTTYGEKVLLHFAGGGDALLDDLVYDKYPFQRHIKNLLATAFPNFDWLAAIATTPSRLALGASGETISGSVLAQVNRRFSFEHLRQRPYDDCCSFYEQADLGRLSAFGPEIWQKTFLPHMIEAGKASGVRLIFIRVERQGPPPRSPSYEAYSEGLARYMARQGVAYYDFDTRQRDIPEEWFSVGDHIRSEYLLRYSELFFSRTKSETR